MARIRKKKSMRIRYWLEIKKERDHTKDKGMDVCNTEMHVRETEWSDVHWVNLAHVRNQLRLLNPVKNLQLL
jgi:hypothetical protein